MREDLKKQLKDLGMFPEEKTLESLEDCIVVTKAEVHNTPGTPPEVQKRMYRIERGVNELLELEKRGYEGAKIYRLTEMQLREDIYEMYFPPIEDTIKSMGRRTLRTGTSGVFRPPSLYTRYGN